jgi:hypothetical protein
MLKGALFGVMNTSVQTLMESQECSLHVVRWTHTKTATLREYAIYAEVYVPIDQKEVRSRKHIIGIYVLSLKIIPSAPTVSVRS